MSPRKLGLLILVILILSGLLLVSDRSGSDSSPSALFADLTSKEVGSILIEQKSESLKLEFKDNDWRVPSRFDFPADANKIRSLLLKIADIIPSQRVTDLPKNFDKLGVGETALKDGYSQITLFDPAGKQITGLKLGSLRKTRGEEGPGTGAGQYIRRMTQNVVYLIQQPITVQTALSEWLKTDILSVPSADVFSVRKFQSLPSGEKLDVELRRVEAKDESGIVRSELGPVEKAGPEEEAQPTAISQLGGGLENVQLVDVLRESDSAAVEVSGPPVARIEYRSIAGLRYVVILSSKAGRYFIKVSVDVDQAVIDTMKKLRADQRAHVSSASSSIGTSLSSSSAAQDTYATAEDAKKVNDRLAPWIFEVAPFQGKRLEVSRNDLFKKKTAPAREVAPESEVTP